MKRCTDSMVLEYRHPNIKSNNHPYVRLDSEKFMSSAGPHAGEQMSMLGMSILMERIL